MKRIQNMADNNGNKISSLPPASVMSGTEEFVFAKGGGNGKVSFSDLLSNIPAATTEAAGLMSALDKAKVNTLGTGTLGARVEIGTDTKIGFETEIGTGVRIDNMVQIKRIIDGNNKDVLVIGTDKYASGVSIEKIGNFGVKIGSAILGGDTGDECYIGSGAYVGDVTRIGHNVFIGDNTSLSNQGWCYKLGTIGTFCAGAEIGTEAIIGRQAKIYREAQIGTGTVIDEGVRIGTDYGVTVDSSNIDIGTDVIIDSHVHIGEIPDGDESSVRISNGVRICPNANIGTGVYISGVSINTRSITDNGQQSLIIDMGQASIGYGAKVYNGVVVGTDTKIGTEVGILNGVKIDEGMWITKDGSSGFYIGTKNHKVYLDTGEENFSVKIGSAVLGHDVKIGDNITIEGSSDKFMFGTTASLGRHLFIGDYVSIAQRTSSGYTPTDYIFGNSGNDQHNIVISNENDVNNQRYRLGTGDTASYIGNNVELKANAFIGENAALGADSGMDYGIYISATNDGKLYIGGDAGQDVYIGRPSYLGIGARVEDGVQVGTNVTVDKTNNMNEIVLGEAFAYRIGTSIVQQASGIKIGEDIRIGRGVTIGDPSTLLGWSGVTIEDGSYLGNGAKVWGNVEIGTAVNIVGVDITGYSDRVVISNGAGKTLTLNWDN